MTRVCRRAPPASPVVWYVPNKGPATDVGDIELRDGVTLDGTVRFGPQGEPAPVPS